MSLHPSPPPLLLTKRLTSFLHANLTPQIESALLVTPTGKLLSYASPAPVSLLRTQSTVCASLWALHSSTASTSGAASYSSSFDSTVSPGDSTKAAPASHKNGHARAPILTLALPTGAVVFLRRLRCGLLFVCIGPEPEQPAAEEAGGGGGGGGGSGDNSAGPATPAAGPASIPGASAPPSGATSPLPPSSYKPSPGAPLPGSSSSETESESVGAGGEGGPGPAIGGPAVAPRRIVSSAETAGTKRLVEGLARWLDDKLGGLTVPEEGIGAMG